MTNSGFFCHWFQRTGRHDLLWQETTERHEIWKCSSCDYEKHVEVEPKITA